MTQGNVQIVRGVYEAFGRGDVPTVLGHMDQTIVWNEAENFIYADGNPYVGPEAVLKGVFMRLGTDWEGVYGHAGGVASTLLERPGFHALNGQFHGKRTLKLKTVDAQLIS